MKIAYCDDDQICLNDVQKHISLFSKDTGYDFEEYSFLNGKDLIESKVSFDIAILDVELPDISGLKLGEYLRSNNPHIILIYLTAHKKYLDDALNLNAVRFFEKPIDASRFYRGLKKAIERIDNTTIKFALKDKGTTDVVNAKDILYVEIENRKSKVVTIYKTYHSAEHISFWENKLQDSVFVVPHKSYIVNLNYITSYQRSSLTINNTFVIPIAKSKQAQFSHKFSVFMEGK